MYKNFQRLRRRLTLATLLKSAVFALSSGIFVSSLIALIYKCAGKIPINSVSLISGTLCALIFIAISLIAFYPSEKRAAKKLDASLSLGEKVSTMIEFKNADGDMIEMQRSDTERILGEADVKKLRGESFLVHLIMPMLAAILLVVTLLIPNPTAEAPIGPSDDDPAFTLSSWQEQALKDLIEDVRRSEMESEPRGATVVELEGLLTELRAAKKVSEMKTSVIGAIRDIKKILSDHNSAPYISLSLASDEQTKALSVPIESLDAITLGGELTEIRTLFSDNDTAKLTEISSEIVSALEGSGVSDTDKLYIALNDFASALSSLASGSFTDSEIDASFAHHGESISSALLVQYTNRSVCDGAVRRLMQIFGISESELPAESRPSAPALKEEEGDYEHEDSDDPLNSGGFGSGDMIFGSDDMIYDPESGKYVSYGEVINRYYAKISEQFADGNVEHELEQLISDYFAALFNGTGENN